MTRLVLLSGTAGIDDGSERRDRRAADGALADRLAPRDGAAPVQSVAAFVGAWLDSPLFAGLSPAAAQVEERLANTAAGLASNLRLAGTGAQDPLWARLAELAMPVLVVAGADDAKFAALGRRLASGIGANARFVVVADAGHALHLEQPAAVAGVVRDFLDEPAG